jgi:hypothetical protein
MDIRDQIVFYQYVMVLMMVILMYVVKEGDVDYLMIVIVLMDILEFNVI